MLGLKRALVVHGKDGLDEITITGPTHIAEVRNGEIRAYDISPEEFGLRSAPISEIQGGDTKANAEIIRNIVAGEKSARRDVVLLNAAAALVVAGRADTIAAGMPIAAESLDSGAARKKLEKLAEFTSGKPS
jgi:anthranilate phosphoribosyltransferase